MANNVLDELGLTAEEQSVIAELKRKDEEFKQSIAVGRKAGIDAVQQIKDHSFSTRSS